jgi:hypothetical protein
MHEHLGGDDLPAGKSPRFHPFFNLVMSRKTPGSTLIIPMSNKMGWVVAYLFISVLMVASSAYRLWWQASSRSGDTITILKQAGCHGSSVCMLWGLFWWSALMACSDGKQSWIHHNNNYAQRWLGTAGMFTLWWSVLISALILLWCQAVGCSIIPRSNNKAMGSRCLFT